ncbi:MAG: hypothetical protein V1760_03860, partial [Candidatus Peregrinibacteria bacterium]
MKKALIYLKILQILVDAILILVAFALAYFLRIGFFFSTDFPFDKYFQIALVTAPITILFMFFARTYKLTQRVLTLRHIQRVGFVSIMNVATFIVLYYFTYRNFFSRLILVYLFVLTFLLIYGWHVVFRWILQTMSSREIGVYRTLIIGANRPAEEIVKKLIETKSHIKPVAIINAHGGGKTIIAGIPVVGKLNVLEKVIADMAIDHIIQTDHLEQTVNILNYALDNKIGYSMPSTLLGVVQAEQILE